MAKRFGDGTTRTRGDEGAARTALPRPARRMRSTTRSFTVGEGKGYLTVSRTSDGTPAEVVVRMAKQGSTLAGMMDAFSATLTEGIQHGVPLKGLVARYIGMRFQPAGLTDDPEIKHVSSVMDYVGRRLALDYLPYDDRVDLNVFTAKVRATRETVEALGEAVWNDLVGRSLPPVVLPPRRG